MKRLHVHIAVDDLEKSIGFYSTLFAAEPSVRKDDYAKWMLEDPRVNLAISQRASVTSGVDHLGIQTETDGELRELATRLKAAGETTRDQEAATCCYAQSNKAWVDDPSGVRWETFFTFGDATTYGEDAPRVADARAQACCAPDIAAPKAASGCGTANSTCC
ncbi:MAG: ArsI/CadI family heavy metal resistance metalloenzyme [Rhizomicrobium sp.]